MTNSRDPTKGDPLAPAGPISGARAASASIASVEAGAVDSTGTAEAVDELHASGAATAGDRIEPRDPVANPSALEGIAQAVASGVIDTGEARARLIEAVVTAHLPPDVDPATHAALMLEVEELLADDPTLAALLKPSTG